MNDSNDAVQKLFEGFHSLLQHPDAVAEEIKEVCRIQADYLPDNPINVVAIANHFKLRVYEANLKGDISGVLDLSEKRIYLERSASFPWKRFACAHELGHFLLHRNRQDVFLFRGECDSKIEKEASDAAEEILMPSHFMRQFLREKMTLPNLAKKFDVPDLNARNKAKSVGSWA